MSSVTVRGAAMPTSLLLLEHAEKIAAAVALRSTVHAEHQALVDRAIRAALADRENGGRVAAAANGSNLTPQDHFYEAWASMNRTGARTGRGSAVTQFP